MKASAQDGLTLPEMVLSIALAGVMLTLIGSLAASRLDAAQYHAQQAESRYLASLVARAHRRGLLAEGAATAADLQQALPDHAIPAQLGSGQTYTFATDGDDPRLLVELLVGFRDGVAVTQPAVVRAPLSASELRIPFWRAQKLRRLQDETE